MKLKLFLAASAALILTAISFQSCRQQPERVVLGDEQLDVYLPLLEGKRVAVFSNHSGIVGDKVTGSKLADMLEPYGRCFDPKKNSKEQEAASMVQFAEPSAPGGTIEYGPHLVDVLLENGVDVRAIFAPEHGFRGKADAGEHVASSIDEQTGVEILSLYQPGSRIPSKEKMDKFDVLVVDIQDVGLRYYTYYVTMHHLMEACARDGKQMIILDRPNPNGFYVDGAILDTANLKSGIGWIPITTVHGMTLGELALMINGEHWLEEADTCPLTVIPCRNYTHNTRYSLIVPPSPNLRDMKSVYLYSTTCYFEGAVVGPARGTEFSFEAYGHPQLDSTVFDFKYTPRSIPGAKHPRYQDELCYGRDLRTLPLEEIWSRKIDFGQIVETYQSLGLGKDYFTNRNHFDLCTGQNYIKEMILADASTEEIIASWAGDVETFKAQREPYLLYPEK